MTVTTTYTVTCGLYTGDGAPISEDDWNLFLVEEVCPLFEGFSVTDVLGFWQGDPEPCRVLTFISDDYEEALQVWSVAASYKQRFQQDAVLINSTSSITDFV